MHQLTAHKINDVNECIAIDVLDDPGPGGACHEYRIRGVQGPLDHHPVPTIELRFQNGPVKEVGVNGITHEALLAILIDRLAAFQRGPFACEENRDALIGLENAQSALHRRTLKRIERGVEGTHEK